MHAGMAGASHIADHRDLAPIAPDGEDAVGRAPPQGEQLVGGAATPHRPAAAAIAGVQDETVIADHEDVGRVARPNGVQRFVTAAKRTLRAAVTAEDRSALAGDIQVVRTASPHS